MKQFRAALVASLSVLAALALPAVAQAHHTDVKASCVYEGGTAVVTYEVKFVGFGAANSKTSINGTVKVNGATSKTVTNSSGVTWTGDNGKLTGTAAGVANQAATVVSKFSWTEGTATRDEPAKTITTNKCPGFEVEKDGPATAYVGDQVTFEYTVRNTGGTILPNPVVTDDKCAPVTKVTQQNQFDPGDVWVYTCTTTITDAMGNQLVNTVSACTLPNDCETDTHTTDIPKPAIALVKTGAETAAAGSTFTYSFAATNTGNVRLENVALTDDKCQATLVRADAEPVDATFDPGDTWNYTCTVTAPAGPAQVDNVATVCGDAVPPGLPPKTVCDDDPHTFTVPPAETPPGDTPPGDTPPGGTPPGQTPPPGGGTGGGVLPEETVSGRAALRGPSGCVRQAFTARVSGREIDRVEFYVDGRMVKRFTSSRSSYAIKVNPNKYGFGRHRVVARVTFSEESGTVSRRLPLTFRRCAQGAVAPRFTG